MQGRERGKNPARQTHERASAAAAVCPGCRPPSRRRRGPSKKASPCTPAGRPTYFCSSVCVCATGRNPTLCWFLCMCNFEDKHRIRHRKRRSLARSPCVFTQSFTYVGIACVQLACHIIMLRPAGHSSLSLAARQTHKKIKALVSRCVLLKYICTEIAFQRLIMHHAILSLGAHVDLLSLYFAPSVGRSVGWCAAAESVGVSNEKCESAAWCARRQVRPGLICLGNSAADRSATV